MTSLLPLTKSPLLIKTKERKFIFLFFFYSSSNKNIRSFLCLTFGKGSTDLLQIENLHAEKSFEEKMDRAKVRKLKATDGLDAICNKPLRAENSQKEVSFDDEMDVMKSIELQEQHRVGRIIGWQ